MTCKIVGVWGGGAHDKYAPINAKQLCLEDNALHFLPLTRQWPTKEWIDTYRVVWLPMGLKKTY